MNKQDEDKVMEIIESLPVSTSTKIFHNHILPNKKDIRFIFRRIKFCGINTFGEFVTTKAPMHDSMIVIFDGRKQND